MLSEDTCARRPLINKVSKSDEWRCLWAERTHQGQKVWIQQRSDASLETTERSGPLGLNCAVRMSFVVCTGAEPHIDLLL